MTKELIIKIAEETGYATTEVADILSGLSSVVANSLVGGEKVKINGIGIFEVRERAARKGRNPQTGAEIEIPAHKVPVFKPSSVLKKAIK